ncbi:MAG: alpha/beta fold hydrolase [Corynebacterium sp.]|nr:alpha/beta fold hydrolase [Corynebacterium sp.]
MTVLHYVRYGNDVSEPPIVFLHSLGGTHDQWLSQMNHFARTRTVIGIDLPGHAISPLVDVRTVKGFADAVLSTLDYIGVKKFVAIGISMGGAVAQELAKTDRVERAALISTNAKFGEQSAWAERAQQARAGQMAGLADATVANWFSPDFQGTHPATVDYYRTQIIRTSHEGYARACEALAAWDNWDGLAEIKVPTLILAGEYDRGCPPEVMEKMAAKIPHGAFHVMEGAAHLQSVERAPEVSAILDTFYEANRH